MTIGFILGLLYSLFLIPSMIIFFKMSKYYQITFATICRYDVLAFLFFSLLPFIAIPVIAMIAVDDMIEDESL